MVGFSQFSRERQYLSNVSPATLEWYKHSFKWLPSESPTQDDLKDAVLRMREKGLKATGCNSAIRAINAYLKWSGSTLKIPQLKEPQLILPTFATVQVSRLVSWKPKGFYQRRLHLLMLVLLDTGCRITEALTLHVSEIDFENLLVTLDGKGHKQRVVPFSFELRKAMFRYCHEYNRTADSLLFANRTQTRLGRRNVLRDVKLQCKRLGFTPPARTLHAFRHTFAIHYLRKGGSVFHLQKVLGHSTLEMTRRYANLLTEDLQAVHERISLLRGAA
ncbi:MAG: site-specific integrase [Candidatus Korobacteraceae bacterium]